MAQKVIMDCDPGHDDALAILLAAKHLDVIGITTVGGNQALEKVTKNALKILELGEITNIPVYKGHEKPSIQSMVHAPECHGESGLEGAPLPEPSIQAQRGHAVDFLIDTVMSTDDVTLTATGPLTNIAAAIHREPRITERIREISLMGGSVTAGNWTAAAEYNIWADPEAAHVVFSSPIPKRMVGLNLTRQAPATPERIERIRNLGNRTGRVMADLVTWFSNACYLLDGHPAVFLYDPCAVAWLIQPDLVRSQFLHVAIELKGEYTRGMTVCDYRCLIGSDPGEEITGEISQVRQGLQPNVNVGLRLDSDGFFELLTSTLKLYP
jgi:pyrimidine-specific ribonucleoside hydrolase